MLSATCSTHGRRLVAVADTDPVNLERFSRRFGITSAYSSYEEMFSRESLDIAAPILPARPNPDAVIAAARAGIPAVFCEKPICASLEDADRMVAEITSSGVHWAAADAMRNLPGFWQVKEMIDSGELGPVRTINIYLGVGGRSRRDMGRELPGPERCAAVRGRRRR